MFPSVTNHSCGGGRLVSSAAGAVSSRADLLPPPLGRDELAAPHRSLERIVVHALVHDVVLRAGLR